MWRAVGIMFIAMSMIPAGDMAGKMLSGTLGASPLFVAWSRFALGLLMILPFVPRDAWRLLRDPRIWGRGLVMSLGITSIQMALSTEPLADVFAAFFIGPGISYALSALVLREPARPLRSLLMFVGFAGVLLVVRPGLGGSPGLLWAVLAGTCYGVFLIASRTLSGLGGPRALLFTQLAIATLVLAPIGLTHLPAPSLPVAGFTLASAAFSMGGNLLLLVAYGRARATILAPLVYFQLIAAVVLGWAVFGDVPDTFTWAGLVLITGAGLASASLRR